MALLCKRGVQLAAYFSKPSSSSTSRSLGESSNVKRVVNHNTLGHGGGRWAAVGGAVRGYAEDASSSSNSAKTKEKMKDKLNAFFDFMNRIQGAFTIFGTLGFGGWYLMVKNNTKITKAQKEYLEQKIFEKAVADECEKRMKELKEKEK